MNVATPTLAHRPAPYNPGRFLVPRERPTAAAVLAFLFAFLLPVSLVPSERGELITLPGMPALWWSTVYLFLFVGVAAAFRILGAFGNPIHSSTKRYLLIPFILLTAWQIASLLWNGRSFEARTYSVVESLGMISCTAAAVYCTSGLGTRTRLNVGRWLTLFVTGVALLYASISFLFPGLRPSSAWMDRTVDSLGFIRVFGPLGVATILNFVLLPALGFAVGAVLTRGWTRLYWGTIAAILSLTVIGTGSRGGLVSLCALATILVLASGARAALAIVPIGAVLGAVLLAYGVPERFKNFEDEGRMVTYATALRAYTDNPRNTVLGAGHGAIYSKLEVGAIRRLRGKSRWYLASEQTPYGNTLRSSHSVFLRTLAETGPVGLALLLTPLTWVFFRAMSPRYHRPRAPGNLVGRCTLAGCAAVIPYMALEDFFITAFWPATIWTMFVVIGSEMLDNA